MKATEKDTNPDESFQIWFAKSAYRSRRRLATVAAIALAVLIGYHVVNGHNGITVYQQKRAEDKALQFEIDRLQQENLRLQGHVERLKTDPDAIIHEARERLHYTLPDEVVVTIDNPPNNPADGTASDGAASNDAAGSDNAGKTGNASGSTDTTHK